MRKPFATLCLLAGLCTQQSLSLGVVPITVDAGTSIQAEAIGSNNPPLYMGAVINPLTGPSQTIIVSKHDVSLQPAGLLIQVIEMAAGYYSGGPGAQVGVRGNLYFTPIVPNLSYTFAGFMNVVEFGTPASTTASSLVDLKIAIPHGPVLYTNSVALNGPGVLWTPSSPQFGTQTGALDLGVQYHLSWDFTLVNFHGGDTTADYAIKLKNGPYFKFELFQRPCPGDLNGDGYVDDADFVAFALAYNILVCSDPAMPPGCPADLNNDGFVDDTDFVIFAGAYNVLLCP